LGSKFLAKKVSFLDYQNMVLRNREYPANPYFMVSPINYVSLVCQYSQSNVLNYRKIDILFFILPGTI